MLADELGAGRSPGSPHEGDTLSRIPRGRGRARRPAPPERSKRLSRESDLAVVRVVREAALFALCVVLCRVAFLGRRAVLGRRLDRSVLFRGLAFGVHRILGGRRVRGEGGLAPAFLGGGRRRVALRSFAALRLLGVAFRGFFLGLFFLDLLAFLGLVALGGSLALLGR